MLRGSGIVTENGQLFTRYTSRNGAPSPALALRNQKCFLHCRPHTRIHLHLFPSRKAVP